MSVLHCYVRNFYRTPAGYTADRKTRRKRDMSCYGLLSAASHPPLHLPPPPHCASVAQPAAMLSGLEGRGRAPPSPHLIWGRLSVTSPKVEDGLHFGDCEYDS